ncbi:MAG: hypothetical protein JSR30_00035 [Proteobacteria bacterium]|nr:hypothetical protein [Pseudomonadota bacterium]
MAAATKLYVNIGAGSLASGLVRGVSDNTPVSFPELVIGDGRTYELYFVDGRGAYASFSGDASYIPQIAIGQCGYPTGGTFTLKFGADTTAPIAYNASAATVQAALEALTSIGAGNVSVVGQGPNYFAVTFIGALAAAPQALLIADFSLLTPASNINVFTLVAGSASPATDAVQVMTLAINPISYADDWTPITNGWTGQLSTSTVAALQAFATAGGSISEVFQVTVLDPTGISTTYVKQPVTIVCTIINPTAYAGTNQPTLATQAQLAAAVLGLNNFTQEALSSSSAGNTNVTRATTSRLHTAIVTFTGTASTRTVSLLTTNSPVAGDKIFLQLVTPATAGLVLEVYNATTGGTLLTTVTTTADAEPFFLVFTWSGSAWVLQYDQSAMLAKIGNLAGLASPRVARQNLRAFFSRVSAKSADFTITADDDGTLFEISAAGGTVTATLPDPSAVGEGYAIALQKSEGSANVILTSPATVTLSLAAQSLILVSDGANWTIPLQYNPAVVAVTAQNVIQNQYSITGLTGGGATNLDGLLTANGATAAYAVVIVAFGSPLAASIWRLEPGVDAAGPGVVRPVDFNSSTNPQVWKQIM